MMWVMWVISGIRHDDVSDSSVQMNVVWLIWVQLKHLVINGSAPLLMLEGLFRTPQSFASLLRFSLWAKHGGHSSGFLRGIYFCDVLTGCSCCGDLLLRTLYPSWYDLSAMIRLVVTISIFYRILNLWMRGAVFIQVMFNVPEENP